MSLLCILGAGIAVSLPLPDEGFELRWVHSVEHTEWRERWQPAPDGLRLVESRVQGSGAGMEPPEGAVLSDGWWIDRSAGLTVPHLSLPLSPHAAPYQVCIADLCRTLDSLLPDGARTAILDTNEPCS